MIMEFYFATVIRGPVRLLLGNGEDHDVGSLVIDRLCDQARGQDVAVACFYFDFVARSAQSSIGMLGALLKQVVVGMEEIPEEISKPIKTRQRLLVDGDHNFGIFRRCCRLPPPKGLHSSASTLLMMCVRT